MQNFVFSGKRVSAVMEQALFHGRDGRTNNEVVFDLRFRLPLIPLRPKVPAQAKGIANMKKTMTSAAATAMTVASLMATSGAQAGLVERLGGKAIYDDVADLTWLQDANYAQTSGYDADGLMNWGEANAWARSLNIDGVTGWHLPVGEAYGGYREMQIPCCDVSRSPLGNLFYNVLGGTSAQSIATIHNANYDLFNNIQPNSYWSGDILGRYSDGTPRIALGVDMGPYGGWTGSWGEWHLLSAWAVHDGDVGASPVPLPATLFLLAPALAGLGVMRRRTA